MSLQEFEEEIQPYFNPVKFQKKDFLLREGQICKSVAFISSGLTRTYCIDEKENHSILAFGLKNYWITDRESFDLDQPAKKYIQALEDTETLILEKKDFTFIFESNELFRNMQIALKERNAIVTYHKVATMKDDTAEVRYSKFVKQFPSLPQRIPQHMIASYLGIKAETLSRLRKNPRKK